MNSIYHCAQLRRPDKYADARVAMVDVFQSNHRCYGYPTSSTTRRSGLA
jgi:hypothetical protein